MLWASFRFVQVSRAPERRRGMAHFVTPAAPLSPSAGRARRALGAALLPGGCGSSPLGPAGGACCDLQFVYCSRRGGLRGRLAGSESTVSRRFVPHLRPAEVELQLF